jgi:hypothetical protein
MTFTSNWRRAKLVAEALRSAKLAALRRGSPASEWAGFTVVGDPWARVAVREPKSPDWAWWAAASGGLALLAAAGNWAVRVFFGRDRSLDHSQ